MSIKIVTLQLKEIIYTALFAILGIVLIVLLICMFIPNKDDTAKNANKYYPGVYSASINLDGSVVDLEVTVSKDSVQSIAFSNLDESAQLMYPLLQPTMVTIEKQIVKNQATDKIKFENTSKATTSLIMDAVDEALAKAEVPDKEAKPKVTKKEKTPEPEAKDKEAEKQKDTAQNPDKGEKAEENKDSNK